MFRVVIRTNGGPSIGMGHLMRCYSLARALQMEGISPIFVVNEDALEIAKNLGFEFECITSNLFDSEDIRIIKGLDPDVVIFDSYRASDEYLNDLAKIAFLVQIDDNDDIYSSYPAHILLNGNLHAHELQYRNARRNVIKLFGLDYLLMNPEYWDFVFTGGQEKPTGILITTGGADFYGLASVFCKSLRRLKYKKLVIVGPLYSKNQVEELKWLAQEDPLIELVFRPKSLKPYIEKSSLVITSAGTTVYEPLTLKKKLVIYTIADNQLRTANTLKKFGVRDLGWYKFIQFNRLALIIEEELNKRCSATLESLYSKFDGKGSRRAACAILEEFKKWKGLQ